MSALSTYPLPPEHTIENKSSINLYENKQNEASLTPIRKKQGVAADKLKR
jgi:hypothetical protein